MVFPNKAIGKQVNEFATPYTVKNALQKGDLYTRLGIVVLGSGNFARKQVMKGFLFLLAEVLYIYYMAANGVTHLYHLIRLGGREQQEVWNEAKGIYEYVAGDNSLLFLLYGIAAIFISVGFIIVWANGVKSGYYAQCIKEAGKPLNSFWQDLRTLKDQNLHKALLAFPVLGVLCFTILPLIFMICMAFTNYSKEGDHLVLFQWVGLDNFIKVLDISNSFGKTFGSVLIWTLCWAVFATFLNYILGMLLAIIINRKNTRGKGFWRICFVLSAAIPQFVSLLLMRTMLQPGGLVNTLLRNADLIDHPLPFLTSAAWARIVVIIVNLWVGIPFTMMQVTGILQNIPAELYEAAKMDGARPATIFYRITLPYMLFVTTPYLIATFMGNVNNFNVIYLLTGGAPVPVGSTAGRTDLLVTWLYKLTIDEKLYNLGAVIGIMTFVVLAIVSLVTYRRSGSYKNEEGFQ